jgi:hypothetical protein
MVCYDQQVECGQLHFEITQRPAATPTSSYEQDAAAAATPDDQDIAEDGRIVASGNSLQNDIFIRLVCSSASEGVLPCQMLQSLIGFMMISCSRLTG